MTNQHSLSFVSAQEDKQIVSTMTRRCRRVLNVQVSKDEIN